MRRREFITLLGGAAAAWPIVARAQQPEQMRRIGVVTGFAETDPVIQARLAIMRRGLQELGWIEGRNIRIDWRFAGNDSDRIVKYVGELAKLKPDVIFAQGAEVLAALRRASTSIPIIFVQVSDPVKAGFVASLARPGGNLTGFSAYEGAMGGKWLEILKEIAPSVLTVALLHHPEQASSIGYLDVLEAGVLLQGVQRIRAGARDDAEIERFLSSFSRQPSGGLIVLPDNMTASHRQRIIALAAQYRLPAIYPNRINVTEGGLISYGAEVADLYRRAAGYVDRILKGEKPADLPVQAPVKYELVINLKTAKALGLTVPPSLLARADEVIE